MDTGCNYCFWALNFRTGALRGPEDRLALTREVGRLQMELTCMYTVTSKYGMINKIKYLGSIYLTKYALRAKREKLKKLNQKDER